MRLLYNALQLLLLPALLILLMIDILRRPEKKPITLARFGFNLIDLAANKGTSPVIWIHALSVGEVTSALPLVEAIRATRPSSCIVFSSTTASGIELARKRIRPFTEHIIAFPFDIVPIVAHFIKRIAPDLFILVETDFWPNLLAMLNHAQVPMVLVNGRISAKSMRSYRRMSFLFRPLFQRFQTLCMQTRVDVDNLVLLGIARTRLKHLGNLKFTQLPDDPLSTAGKLIDVPPECILLLCGSTHPGEEALILHGYRELSNRFAQLTLAIAPRDIRRSEEIIRLSDDLGLKSCRFSSGEKAAPGAVMIIDTLGDLPLLYREADIAFIGGSIVPTGGHNPLEAIRCGCPVLFGPHMDDFLEIKTELLEREIAFEVADQPSFESTVSRLVSSTDLRRSIERNCTRCMLDHANIIPAHLAVLETCLNR